MADKKPKADTSWVTDDLLDALAWQESKWDVNAESPSGAKGMYQWMPAFYKEGKEVGFGVPKGPFDPTDPVESRKRTKAYLEGMQKYYPDWDPTEVLMAYNWGHGNVRKLKSGEMSMEDYMAQGEWEQRKAAEAMNYAPKILTHLKDKPWMANLEETGLESTIE
jgi:soluble lytic murein transglycosylase-like protein